MEAHLSRKWFTDKSTVGILILGDYKCYTLEDKSRPLGVKFPKETAIPPGTYKVVVTMSPHFKVEMPLLLDVPMFTGIRIHSGNDAGDTEGCILVGVNKDTDWISSSRVAYKHLFPLLKKYADLDEGLYLTITEDPETDSRTLEQRESDVLSELVEDD